MLISLAAAAGAIAAITPTEWQYRQGLPVAAPGLVKIAVPATTFDLAQPGLADLRVLDPNGQEIPYLLDRDPVGPDRVPEEAAGLVSPKSFRATAGRDSTQLVIETGITDNLEMLELESAAPYFLKAAHVDLSADGQTWQSLGAALPVFRQFGAEQLRMGLNRRAAAFVRVTIDNIHSRPVEFSGARLRTVPPRAKPAILASVGSHITRREEFAGETVFTLTLDGRHVPLAALAFEAQDPLFMRRVTVSVREVRGDISVDRTVGSGTIYRVALDGTPAQAELTIPLHHTPATRELSVQVHNGDSPPLLVSAILAMQHPVTLLFRAPAAGAYTLLSGNPAATPAQYDLAAFAGELREAGAVAVEPGPAEAVPGYHPRDSLAGGSLPDASLAGAPLDARKWKARKAVRIEQPGVQELELDPEVLGGARPDYADVRLLREGNQVPYVLEQPALARSLMLVPALAPDPKRPTVSIWRVPLPQPNLPVRRLVLASATPLFQRQMRIYEKLTDGNGVSRENELTAGNWSHTPEAGMAETKILDLSDRLQSDTLWIETDNDDNPAITLGAVQIVYPVVRLVFKASETEGFELAYGYPAASAPRYDLRLVAGKLLTASRHLARLPAAQSAPAAASRHPFAGINGGYIFWGVLALVVVVLLIVVARLLPKP